MILDLEDRASPCWLKIRKHLEARIIALRQSNDTDMNDVQTSKLRGKIAEATYLLSLGQPPTEVNHVPDEF